MTDSPPSSLLRKPTDTPDCIDGRVSFAPVAVGSKQQHLGPVIVDDAGQAARVFIIGDNPFSHVLARKWEGRRVSAAGTWKNGVLEVEEIDMVDLDSPKSVEE